MSGRVNDIKKVFTLTAVLACLLFSGCTNSDEPSATQNPSPTDTNEPSSVPDYAAVPATPDGNRQPQNTPTPAPSLQSHTEVPVLPLPNDSVQITKLAWKGIVHGNSFFDLYITIDGEDHYVGNFFGANLWTHEEPNAPENILTFFRGMWTGAGEDFYIQRKSDTELAVMNHTFQYGADPYEIEWADYKEVLVITIEKDSKIEIEEPIISKGYGTSGETDT